MRRNTPDRPGRSGARVRPGLTHLNNGERFQLIRPHASGGIGQVWLARDSELQRDVAIKEIQPRFAEHADQRARFVLEAEVTGNLEHPGIVPVYSLGKNAEGRPYYAMRFIRGESLAVAIRRFHHDFRQNAGSATTRSRRPSKWGIEFRQLVRRFLDVCNAIDYAHSRGVLHRDLKPANIMLGHYGETLVVDWGLAKVIGKDDVGSRQPKATWRRSFRARIRHDLQSYRAGHDDRHSRLYEPRAGQRPDRPARSGQRRLQSGREPVRAADRAARLPR